MCVCVNKGLGRYCFGSHVHIHKSPAILCVQKGGWLVGWDCVYTAFDCQFLSGFKCACICTIYMYVYIKTLISLWYIALLYTWIDFNIIIIIIIVIVCSPWWCLFSLFFHLAQLLVCLISVDDYTATTTATTTIIIATTNNNNNSTTTTAILYTHSILRIMLLIVMLVVLALLYSFELYVGMLLCLLVNVKAHVHTYICILY